MIAYDFGSGVVPWRAAPDDAALVAQMLDDFNNEFGTPTPGPAVLRSRLDRLLSGDDVVALLVGEPASGLAVLSFRPNVWFDGPVALLAAACDLVRSRGGELFEINVDGDDIEARRFYEARGFRNSERDHPDQLLYYYREL